MRIMTTTTTLALAVSGCASIDFDSKQQGTLKYFEPKPYLAITIGKDCEPKATALMLPGQEKRVHLESGYGSSKLTLALTNGMITNVGQETSSGATETMASLGALATGMAAFRTPGVIAQECTPSTVLYPIVDGTPDTKSPVKIP